MPRLVKSNFKFLEYSFLELLYRALAFLKISTSGMVRLDILDTTPDVRRYVCIKLSTKKTLNQYNFIKSHRSQKFKDRIPEHKW